MTTELETPPSNSLPGLVASWLIGSLLFVPLWAGVNFLFGSALDGPIGAFIMEPACQRLARTQEPLTRYSLATGRSRSTGSVCHFATGPVRVDGRTEGLGFTQRELAYLVVGLAGYALCFAAALTSTLLIVRLGQRSLRRR